MTKFYSLVCLLALTATTTFAAEPLPYNIDFMQGNEGWTPYDLDGDGKTWGTDLNSISWKVTNIQSLHKSALTVFCKAPWERL